jgi:hypothetical protein
MPRASTKQESMFMITKVLRRSWVLEPHPSFLLDASPLKSTKASWFVHHDFAVQERDNLPRFMRSDHEGSPGPWDGRRLWHFDIQSVLCDILGRCGRCADIPRFRPNNGRSYRPIVRHVVEDLFRGSFAMCVWNKVFRGRMDKRRSFEGSPTNVAQPGRVIEAQSSHTWIHPVLSLVLLTPLEFSSESAHVHRNCSCAGLALVIARLL